MNKSHGAIPSSDHYWPDGSNAKLEMGQNDPREGSSVKRPALEVSESRPEVPSRLGRRPRFDGSLERAERNG